MAEWTTHEFKYPSGEIAVNTSISFGKAIAGSYWHVNGGFKLDRYRKNAKTYADEVVIRAVLLTKIRREVARIAKEIERVVSLLKTDDGERGGK
jgi:hypothetical protein